MIYLDEDGKFHREDGPAFDSNGAQYWYHHGKCHRTDGPAIIHNDGYVEHYINGIYLTEEEFNLYKFINKL